MNMPDLGLGALADEMTDAAEAADHLSGQPGWWPVAPSNRGRGSVQNDVGRAALSRISGSGRRGQCLSGWRAGLGGDDGEEFRA
jgi:hypothetical protein